DKLLEDLAKRHNQIMYDMSAEGKAMIAWAAFVADQIGASLKKEADATVVLTEKQLHIREQFAKEYAKLTMTTEEAEIVSLNVKLEEFRKAAISEIEIEKYKQAELRNIKLRAQNEQLALMEELYRATANDKYKTAALNIMDEILKAEEEKNRKILQNDDDALFLREKHYREYVDKLKGMIGEVITEEVKATEQAVHLAARTGETAREAARSTGMISEHGLGEITGKSYIETSYYNFNTVNNAAASYSAPSTSVDPMIAIMQKARSLQIELMSAEAALIATRQDELAALDASLRPLQQAVYAQEDLAAATEKATKAAEAAAEAQERVMASWRDRVATLVDQGQSVRDFLATLGATGTAATFTAARSAYASDLMAARAGDADAYSRITSSAGAYISAGMSRATSALDQARLVAQVRSQLSGLEPVTRLDENIELLKLIDKSTAKTATATESLKLNGIKANFDLSQVITFIANSEGIPDDLRRLITDQTKDYQVWLKSALDSSVSDDLRRILIDGAGQYVATVKAIMGTADPNAQKLAIAATGEYITIVKASLGVVDAESRTLALTAGNSFLTTVGTALGIVDPTARALALNTSNTLAATINASIGVVSADTRKLALDSLNTITATINAAIGAADATTQALALNTTNAIMATVNAALGTVNADAKKLGLNAANTLAATVTAAMGLKDPTAVSLAMNQANTIAATITAALGQADSSALTLALGDANTFAALITAKLSTDYETTKALAFYNAAAVRTVVSTIETSPSYYVPGSYDNRYSPPVWSPGRQVPAHGFILYNDGSKDYYAQGGVFDSGIVTRPTAFNNSMMGENGPEAIMPLVRGPEGLGVRAEGNVVMIEELRRLRDEVAKLRAENKAENLQLVKNTGKMAGVLTRCESQDGALTTVAAT
ncbi:MAG: hypothetical protein V2A66_00610, partial [Pseudomonadota bacterium]